MRKICKWALALTMTLTLTFSSSAFAFQDTKGLPEEAKILSLKEAGVIGGIDKNTFAPRGQMTFAQGIHMIVKGLDLGIDNLKFVQKPKASDYFTNVPDKSWYASSFVIAQLNGLNIPKNVDPNKPMTREQFAHYLFGALMTTGDYAFIEIWIQIADGKNVASEYMNSIQKLLVAKIASLDGKGNFRPKDIVTRAEAAVMVHDARKFVKSHKEQKPEQPDVDKDVSMQVDKVTDEVNKVTLTWGEKPNAGYRITVDRIEFHEDGKAVVYYSLHTPIPGHMYAQVITTPKAEAFVSAKYTPEIKRSENSGYSGAGVSAEASVSSGE